MNKLKWIFLMGVSMSLFLSLKMNAQSWGKDRERVKMVLGDFIALKGQTTLNVEYVYDNLLVGDNPEKEYIKEKMAKYNKDEPGKGDKWLSSWKDDRTARYQPKFEEAMNKYLKKTGIKVGLDTNAKYTLILKTSMIEPGYNAAIVSEPAYINVEVLFVGTNNKSVDLAKARITKAPGSNYWGFDFTSGKRVEEAYERCGMLVAKLMLKNGLK